MKKQLVFIPLFIAAAIFISQCLNKNTAPVQKAAVANPLAMTHKEAVDSLLVDSSAPIKPLKFKELNAQEVLTFLNKNRLDSLFVSEYPYPVNGFYGEDRYRIEFIIDACTQDKNDPSVYQLVGRDRHKKNITPFVGTFKINRLRTFEDPNLDTSEVDGMKAMALYAAEGVFQLDEDKANAYSGQFKGTVKFEFSTNSETNRADLWFYSKQLPSSGAGYRFDGNWTSYTKPDMVKPVIFAADLFIFANDILKDFSMGEREVEINKKYQDLGWKDIWENEEWWTKAEKPKM